MRRKYAQDGVVCVSVCVTISDNEKDQKEERQAALKFLQAQGADFPNYFLDDQNWSDRFELNGPPAVYVFDRDNRRAARFDNSDPDKQYSYDDVENVVKQLLAKPKSGSVSAR